MAPTKQISTSVGFQDSKGTVVANGMLMLQLSQTATVTASGGQVTTEPIYLNLDANGKITTTAIWFVDELSPSGLIYYGTVYSSNKTRIIPGLEKLQYSIAGASFDLATAVQSGSASPSFSGAVLLTPSGNQTITTGNLTLTTGSFIETTNAVTGTGGLVRANSPILSTPSIGTATATSINKVSITQPASAATLTIANGKILTVSNTLTFAGTDSTTHTFQASDTIVGRATTDTLTNKTVTGASSGNSITLLNAQGALGALTGNAADQTIYTFTIPAGTIGAGKGIRITVFYVHTTGNGLVTYKMKLGSTTIDTAAITDNANSVSEMWQGVILNNSGVQNAQTFSRLLYFGITANASSSVTAGASAENTANALALTWTFNAANTEQVTAKQWIVELIQ